MSGGRLVVNVVAFQLAWLAIVIGAAAGRAWPALLAAAAVVALHLASSAAPLRELQALLVVSVLGSAWDSLPAAAGLIDYRGAAPLVGAAPYWIAALWLVFATTLNVALRWLRARVVLAALLGAAAGPLCYLAGEALGALQFVQRPVGLAVQALGWAVLLPLSLLLAARLDGTQPLPRPDAERSYV